MSPAPLRIVVIGDGAVGKSCCTLRFTKNQFFEQYDPTVEETYTKQVDHEDGPMTIEIIDTAGQDDYHSFREASMAYGQAFLLVFSIADNGTFEKAKSLSDESIRGQGFKGPVLVIGNKLDLVRVVKEDEAREWCRSNGYEYMETSAKTGANVEAAFMRLVELILQNRKRGGAAAAASAAAGDGKSPAAGENNGGCCVLL